MRFVKGSETMDEIIRISNYEEILEQLTKKLIEFDKRKNKYQTDVYMYIDEDTKKAELDEFVNVGGNSWLNDDHITIYSDREHYDDDSIFLMYGGSVQSLAEELGISEEQLLKQTREFCHYDEEDEVSWGEIEHYVSSVDEYKDIVDKSYEEVQQECYSNFADSARLIMDEMQIIPAEPVKVKNNKEMEM